MWICISSRQFDDLGKLSSGIVPGWGGWHTRQRWCRLWSRLSASVGWRCTCFFVSPECLQSLRGAILGRKASSRVIWMKHSWVSLYCSCHIFMPWKLHTRLFLFLDLGMRFVDQKVCILYCGAQKPFFGHFGHIQCEAHVGLFQLYLTSLPCHYCRHVENQQAISCCFWQWDLAITSTIYTSVASTKVFKSCFTHLRECISRNLSTKITELTTMVESCRQRRHYLQGSTHTIMI